MSASSPSNSLSSSSSKDDEELWEDNPQISRINSLDCWDYTIELECLRGPEDLQLAAELGKTLLERNKELEGTLKQQQLIIDDQSQEIEYLTKQTVALREVNDSRLRIYENLEVSILDLERGNHRLVAENATVKKQNKTLCHNTDTLEARCEELSKQIEELNQRYDIERRKNERILQEKAKKEDPKKIELRHIKHFSDSNYNDAEHVEHMMNNSGTENISCAFVLPGNSTNSLTSSSLNGDVVDPCLDLSQDGEKNKEIMDIMYELDATKRHYFNEQQRVAELEEQLISLIQENQTLQNRIAQSTTNEEMKSMHDELSILEEVRHGKMCSRCLRGVDDKIVTEEDVSIIGTEDGDDQSLNEIISKKIPHTYRSDVTIKVPLKNDTSLDDSVPNSNPYRELVEKYEALLEVQRQPLIRNRQLNNLHDELTSSDFSSINTKDTDDDCGQKNRETGTIRKTCLRTPTDFSEAETSSSGFSDETSNKFTQTDETFLCTIADGEDKFSIYDDASPIDSRFRNRPEYRELFKEIFAILKKAAENKDEGEKLPLLDDTNPCFKVPPVTPAVEELPAFPDDTESVVSSVVSEKSVAMSERITKRERKTILDTVKKHVEKNGQENKPPTGKHILEDGRVLTPFKRQPLEYLAVSVNIKKKNRKKSKSSLNDRCDSPILPSPPRIFHTGSAKKRREIRPATSSIASSCDSTGVWNGSSMTIYNRNIQSPLPISNNSSFKSREFDTTTSSNNKFKMTSTASQDLHKLIKLDLSYAEVLRRADHMQQRRK